MLADPNVAELYRHRYPAVVVDEVQDLTVGHLELAGNHRPDSRVFAGDEAQGIYGFAGAQPDLVLQHIAELGPRRIPLGTSYRSAPCILEVVTALGEPLGAEPLVAHQPEDWEGRSSFDVVAHADASAEAAWVVEQVQDLLAKEYIATAAVMARGKPRRRFVDEALADAGINFEAWDDPTHAIEVRELLRKHVADVPPGSHDPVRDLWNLSIEEADEAVDFDLRRQLQEACHEMREVRPPLSAADLLAAVANIRTASDPDTPVGPGLHVLNGHIGKGQEFDAVIVIGLEEYFLPGYSAIQQSDSFGYDTEMDQELAVLRVMASRARFHLTLSHAEVVPDRRGEPLRRDPSRFLALLDTACPDRAS